MERSTKRIISIIVGFAAIVIIWKVGFDQLPAKPTTQTQKPAATAGQPPAGGAAANANRGTGNTGGMPAGMGGMQAAMQRPGKAERLAAVAELEKQADALRTVIQNAQPTDPDITTLQGESMTTFTAQYNEESNAINQIVTTLNNIRPLGAAAMGGRGGRGGMGGTGSLTTEVITELTTLAQQDSATKLVARLGTLATEAATTQFANRGGTPSGRGGTTTAALINDPNDPLTEVAFNSVPMTQIIQRLTEWKNKPIIPTGNSLIARITVYAPSMVPRSKALGLIYMAMKVQGYGIEETDEAIFIKDITTIKGGEIPLITDRTALAMIDNREQIVRMMFILKNVSPSKLAQILQPLMGTEANLVADEDTSSLSIIDTVRNLMKYSLIIDQYDIVMDQGVVQKIFELKYRSPTEIITLLQSILAENGTSSMPTNFAGRGGNVNTTANAGRGGANARGGRGATASPTAVSVGTTRASPMLIAETTNNWIIAKAVPEDMETISKWITNLDLPISTFTGETPLASFPNQNQKINYTFRLQYNTASQINQIITPFLSTDGYISADENTGTLMIMDTVANLINIENVIKTFDVPEATSSVQQIFVIKEGDPDEISQLITILLNGTTSGTTGNRLSTGLRTTTTGRTTGTTRTTTGRGG